MPPGKATAALAKRRREKLTGLAEDNCGHSFAQPCGHRATRTERLPDGHVHHSRLTCAVCGRHLRWLPRPETIERQRLNAFRLAKLTMHSGLSEWDRSFVRDVSKLAKLSPKQQQIIDRLCADYLKREVAS
jgi:hypothetical protein